VSILSKSEGEIVEYEPSMAKDVAEMFNKFKESWPGGFGGGIPFDKERVSDWLDESSSIANLVAIDDDGIPVGICELTPHWREKGAAYVGLLGVIQRAKGKKFGKRLLLRSIEKAIEDGIERVDLHTWSGNLNAMPLYKKVGMFWVPDTTVYMQDYIPLLHQNELTKGWLDKHEDWYQHQKKEIEQEPDDMTVQDMKIYRYRFEAEDDQMEVDIDRYGWGITGISRKIEDEEFTVKARVDSHEIFVGIENRFTIEIENDTEEKKEIDIEVNPFEGLKFMEDFPSSVSVGEGGTKIISREFIVDDKAETYESSHKSSETIDTFLKINGEECKLVTGGKIEPAVEIDTYKDVNYLFSGKEKEIYFDLQNRTDKALKGELIFEIDGDEKKKRFSLERKENAGLSLPIQLDFDDEEVKYIESTPHIEREDGSFPMETYNHPLVSEFNGLLTFAEKEDEVYLLNDELKVKAELEGGKITVSEETRDSELPFELRQQVGPPFGKTRDSTLRFDHDLIEDKKGLHLILHGESQHKPGVLIKKHVRIQQNCSEVEFWSELENVSDKTIKTASETSTRKWGLDIEPYNSKAKLYTPLGDELIESDPVTDMLSGTLVPTDPEEWKETWTAYEDIADGAVSGLMWSDNNLKKIKLVGGLLSELKSVSKKLEPGESFESTRLWISAKKASLNSFRETWNRLVGKEHIGRNERVYGKQSRKHIEVSLDENVLVAGEESERTVIIEKAVAYPMPGEYTIKFPEHMNGSFSDGEEKIEISKERDDKEIRLSLEIEVSKEHLGCVDNLVVHYSGERELDFDLPVIVKRDGEVKVQEKVVEGETVLHVDNGEIRFDVLDNFGGNLIRLEDSEGNTYLDDRFPEPGPKSYFENHIGGVEPRLITQDTFESFYEIEDVCSEKVSEGKWKGVKVNFTIEKLDELRGQKFSIKYLTLPGTKLIKMILIHDNPESREVNWLGEFFIDVLLGDSLEGSVVECPGKYEDWKIKHRSQNFMPPANIEKPWFYFKKEDLSIGGFAVEGSPAYSMVLCNDEINMAFLASNLVTEPKGREKIELGLLLDGSKEEIEKARRALSSL